MFHLVKSWLKNKWKNKINRNKHKNNILTLNMNFYFYEKNIY